MAAFRMEAYEGPENYIFVSYAHKDKGKVYPLIRKLMDRGYRIWYDEGITPGSEWPENIAVHLNNSAVVLAFITPNSMDSINCRREINFALSKKKPFLSVVLEPTKMPLGMELQLNTQQSVLRHRYSTEDAFIQKICTWPDIRCCNNRQEQEDNHIGQELPKAAEKTSHHRRVSHLAFRYGNLMSSASSGIGALLLITAAVLLFGNYHQDNLVRFVSIPPFPDRISDFLAGVWHELPSISSPEFRDMKNWPAIAWLIGVGWFLRQLGRSFSHYKITEKLVRTAAVVQCTVIVAHLGLCAKVETASQQMSRADIWLPYYFPPENLAVIGIMILGGIIVGRAVDRIAEKILSLSFNTED